MAAYEAFGPAWMTTTGSEVVIPPGSAGQSMLSNVTAVVPAREAGRQNWHRERYCILRVLTRLAVSAPHLFPLRVVRQEAPDFLLYPAGAEDCIACEHGDLSDPGFQAWANHPPPTPGQPVVDFCPEPAQQAEKFAEAFRQLLSKKGQDKVWRSCPTNARCWLITYPQAWTLSLDEQTLGNLMLDALPSGEVAASRLDRIVLVQCAHLLVVRPLDRSVTLVSLTG